MTQPPPRPPPRQVPQVGTCLCSNILPGTWLFYEQRHLQGKALMQPGLRLRAQSRAFWDVCRGMQTRPAQEGHHLSHLSHLPRPRPALQALPLPSRPAHITGPAPALQAPPLPSRPAHTTGPLCPPGPKRTAPGPAHTCVGQEAVAFVPCHVINTRALVQTRVGRTLVDVGLAVGPWRERKHGQVTVTQVLWPSSAWHGERALH